MITRKVTRNTLARWGIPVGSLSTTQAEVLDIVDLGGDSLVSYRQMVFVAPDDGNAYQVDYATGGLVSDPFEGFPDEITLTRVRSEKQVVTLTNWIPVTEEYLAGPKVLAVQDATW